MWCWRRLGPSRATSPTPSRSDRISDYKTAMALKVAFQMDPIERIDIRGNSTFALLLEAQWRGHDAFYYTPDNLSLKDGKLIARGHSLTVEDKPGDHYRLAHPPRGRSSEVRRGASAPGPALRHELHHHHASAGAHSSRRRSWSTIRPRCANAPEKLFVLDFPELMPPTLITALGRSDQGVPRASTGTSSSSRFTAMAAPACSACPRTTPISIR